MAALHSRCGHYSFVLWFLLSSFSSFFFFLFFLAQSQPSEIGCLPYFHTWCGISANLECRSEMWCRRIVENSGRKKSPKIHHVGTIAQLCWAVSSQLRHLSTIGKKLLNSNISACPYSMANFGPLTAVIGSEVSGAPANLNGFRVLASLLQRHRSPETNQTLHDVWPSPGLVRYVYIFGGSFPPWWNFSRCKIHFTSKSSVLLYWQRYCTALQQRASAKLCGVVQGMELRNFRRRRHLYSAGRPSRWASAHILVLLRNWCKRISRSLPRVADKQLA